MQRTEDAKKDAEWKKGAENYAFNGVNEHRGFMKENDNCEMAMEKAKSLCVTELDREEERFAGEESTQKGDFAFPLTPIAIFV